MIKPIGLFCFIVVFLFACTNTSSDRGTDKKIEKVYLEGETMGTTFSVAYLDSNDLDFSLDLQNLLIEINQSVSTYEPASQISIFNKKQNTLSLSKNGHFARNYSLARTIYQKTEGWFNPSVMPLVNYWGFGYTEKKMVTEVDSFKVTELLNLVQFDSIQQEELGRDSLVLIKKTKGLQLDFSAIAKGDAVDEVGRFLESKGIENYFVEIGGEVRARGTTVNGFNWRTGIRSPKEGARTNEMQIAVELPNLALATSGNYENYYEDKNTKIKYAHTINPHTGYPEKSQLLSASVFAKDCAIADAFATAFMAMGLEKAIELSSSLPEIEAYFIYSDDNGNIKEKYTKGVYALMKLGS